MTKKLVGVLLVTGVAAAGLTATRNLWLPAVKAGLQDALLWALDHPSDDDEAAEVEVEELIKEGSIY